MDIFYLNWTVFYSFFKIFPNIANKYIYNIYIVWCYCIWIVCIRIIRCNILTYYRKHYLCYVTYYTRRFFCNLLLWTCIVTNFLNQFLFALPLDLLQFWRCFKKWRSISQLWRLHIQEVKHCNESKRSFDCNLLHKCSRW